VKIPVSIAELRYEYYPLCHCASSSIEVLLQNAEYEQKLLSGHKNFVL